MMKANIVMMMVKIIFFKWYNGYKKRKSQKVSIKEELLPITWQKSRYWDSCMSEKREKKGRKKGYISIVGISVEFFCIR